MNETLIKFVGNLIPFKKLRKNFKNTKIKELHEREIAKRENIKLIMTLVCKDEIDIIEKHILFHHHMGIDGYIVTDNNSTDGTREVLEKYKQQGIILEIIDEPCKTHMHSVWVDRMVWLAKNKYHADWVINSDSDEFWYASSLNLKKDIGACGDANVLNLYFKTLIPSLDQDDYFNNTLFVSRLLQPFEAENLGITNGVYINYKQIPKVMHRTKGFIHVLDGNHGVHMKKPNVITPANISLYHYYIRNFKHFEQKVTKGYAGVKDHPKKGIGSEWREWYEKYYSKGRLKDALAKKFSFEDMDKLKEAGCVVNDPSVINFMKYKKII